MGQLYSINTCICVNWTVFRTLSIEGGGGGGGRGNGGRKGGREREKES